MSLVVLPKGTIPVCGEVPRAGESDERAGEADGRERSLDLVVEVYDLAKKLPASEHFGMLSQLQRAVVSVPLNISEGQQRLHRRDFLHHLSIARGSLAEVETLLEIAVRLGYLTDEAVAPVQERIRQVGRMLNGLIKSLDDSPDPLHGR